MVYARNFDVLYEFFVFSIILNMPATSSSRRCRQSNTFNAQWPISSAAYGDANSCLD